jgi:hypothetical protein
MLKFNGQEYSVNPITDHHIAFLAELYDETGISLQYDLEKESQALKLIVDYICPSLPDGLVFVTAKKEYVWMESHQLFAEMLIAVAKCYATYFDKNKLISEAQKEQLDNADKLLQEFKESVKETPLTEAEQLKARLLELEGVNK